MVYSDAGRSKTCRFVQLSRSDFLTVTTPHNSYTRKYEDGSKKEVTRFEDPRLKSINLRKNPHHLASLYRNPPSCNADVFLNTNGIELKFSLGEHGMHHGGSMRGTSRIIEYLTRKRTKRGHFSDWTWKELTDKVKYSPEKGVITRSQIRAITVMVPHLLLLHSETLKLSWKHQPLTPVPNCPKGSSSIE
ncbi:hypothetical protein AVEN_223285-1 [Araneus ventricosus]|uniref:Uncharacterized protein n=1 Tax=Araneus ventricosus TaxID=182803 RepID=A0A4Y2LIE3_ARAVE|nr:hypothetical protein AVEN_223285-1 [Araneus ventricosus]